MENASKALIIAGGILIGIIIASIFVYEISFAVQTGQSHERELARTKIVKFNSQFTVYLGKKMTPQDAATLINFVDEWNRQNPDDKVYVNYTGAFEGESLRYFIDNNAENKAEKFLLKYTKFTDNAEPKCYFECKIDEYYTDDRDERGRVKEITIHVNEN